MRAKKRVRHNRRSGLEWFGVRGEHQGALCVDRALELTASSLFADGAAHSPWLLVAA